MALRLALALEFKLDFDFALHFSSFHFNPLPFRAISGSAVPLGLALFKNLRLFMERINFGRIFLCHFTRQSIKMGTHTRTHTHRHAGAGLGFEFGFRHPCGTCGSTLRHRRHRRRGHGHGRAANKMKYINFATI